jgi:acetolactate synthase small subunit
MAIDVGELLVSIRADLTDLKKGLEESNKKVSEFGAGTVAKGALIADAVKTAGMAVLKFGMDSLKAFGDSQAAVSKLELALKNNGQEVKTTSKQLQDYATSLQKVTTFSDEAIVETEAMLANFGLAGEELKSTTRAALDLSKGLGIDLRTATLMLGKAAEGETGTLARYGIIIGDNVPKAQAFEKVLQQVNTRFGGAAQNDLANINGKMENFANRINDIQEKIGKFLLPAFDFWAQKADTLIAAMDRLTGAGEKEARGRELTIEGLKREQQLIIQGAKERGSYRNGVLSLTDAEQKRLNLIGRSMARERQMLAAEEKTNEKKVESVKSRVKQIARLNAEEQAAEDKKNANQLAKLDAKTAQMLGKQMTYASRMIMLRMTFNEQDTALLTAYLDETEQVELASHLKQLEEHGKFNDAKLLKEQTVRNANSKAAEDELKETKRRNTERAQNFQSTLNFISSLAQEKNKVLAGIGKASAVSVATIDTFQAANKALASAPPPFNFGLAAAVTAAGIANVSRIVGVKLARGGVVEPRSGGTSAVIGEAGQAEAVIPLEDPRTTKLLGKALAGTRGGVTLQFNISGHFIEGSKSKMQRMIREAVIPEIHRYTEIRPVSEFNRRRGQA